MLPIVTSRKLQTEFTLVFLEWLLFLASFSFKSYHRTCVISWFSAVKIYYSVDDYRGKTQQQRRKHLRYSRASSFRYVGIKKQKRTTPGIPSMKPDCFALWPKPHCCTWYNPWDSRVCTCVSQIGEWRKEQTSGHPKLSKWTSKHLVIQSWELTTFCCQPIKPRWIKKKRNPMQLWVPLRNLC